MNSIWFKNVNVYFYFVETSRAIFFNSNIEYQRVYLNERLCHSASGHFKQFKIV